MASEADQAARVKRISNELEATFDALRKAASHISGLLQLGTATCEEVRAYNAWALAIFEAQKGMLTSLRAAGQTNIPAQPPAPTLFPIKGKTGLDAVLINCGDGKSLAGLMLAAMKPSRNYVSTNDIAVSTQDPWVYRPELAPSFAQLVAQQKAREAQVAGLGVFTPFQIFIAAVTIVVVVSAALTALFKYLETSEIQESNTEQVRLQAQAFSQYLEARLQCMAACTSKGTSTGDCASECDEAIGPPPEFRLPGEGKPWGTLQWLGFTVLLSAGLWVGWKIYQRKQAGKPILELPSFDDDAHAS